MKSDANALLLMQEWNLTLEFDVKPAIEKPFSLVKRTVSAQTDAATYQSNEYLLTITKEGNADCETIDFSLKRTDDIIFTTLHYAIQCAVPVVDLYNVSPLFLGYAFSQHHNPETFRSGCTTKDAPLVIYGSRAGENRFTIGLEKQYIETAVSRGRHESLGYMHYDRNIVRFERPTNGVTLHQKEISDCIYINHQKVDWFTATKQYWDFIDKRRNYMPNYTPQSAYGPLWCSWLYLTDIDEDKIWATALKAKELGIKTLMIDAGWFCEDKDIPFPNSPLTNKTFGFGRIDSDGSKFSNMKDLVRRIHELGLYVWAWCTPRWAFYAIEQGQDKVDQKLLDCRIIGQDGKTKPMLCTRHPNTREHAAKFTAYLLKEYAFDGLKFDCWELDDGMDICCSDHEHDCDTMGEGTMKWGKAIYESMTTTNKEAVVWLNNTVMKPYSNYSCSPNEVYCQPDENYRMSTLVKTFDHGILTHLSEGAWNYYEPDKELSRQLFILMMGHVPEVQVDLTNLSNNHERILKSHLAFYEQHKQQLLFGKYTPFGFEHMQGGPLSTTLPHVKIEGEDDAFCFIETLPCELICFENTPKHCYLFNMKNLDGLRMKLTGLDKGRMRLREYDYFMNTVSQIELDCNGIIEVDSKVACGCMLSIEAI